MARHAFGILLLVSICFNLWALHMMLWLQQTASSPNCTGSSHENHDSGEQGQLHARVLSTLTEVSELKRQTLELLAKKRLKPCIDQTPSSSSSLTDPPYIIIALQAHHDTRQLEAVMAQLPAAHHPISRSVSIHVVLLENTYVAKSAWLAMQTVATQGRSRLVFADLSGGVRTELPDRSGVPVSSLAT